MKALATTWLTVCVITLAFSAVLAAEKKLKYTGTFTNLEYNKEGGDLLGEEIKIVLVPQGYQGALQIAEGGPSQLMVFDVIFDGDRIKFEIPSSYPIYGSGVFEGQIDTRGIRGVLRFKGGAANRVNWKRGRSYWDR
jgi:hypothetical protein